MIIVSQDKETIINFDNIIRFFIGFADENKKRSIRYEGVNKTYEELGIYETEERAREVLQEIIEAIVTSKKASEAGGLFKFSIIPSDTYYQMPEA